MGAAGSVHGAIRPRVVDMWLDYTRHEQSAVSSCLSLPVRRSSKLGYLEHISPSRSADVGSYRTVNQGGAVP